jgi:hypothetical protein
METRATQHGSLLAWQEGNCRNSPTCRAYHGSLHTHTRLSALPPAPLAAPGVMLEMSFAKEDLLADGENEWLSTVIAGQRFVTIFQCDSPPCRHTICPKTVRSNISHPGSPMTTDRIDRVLPARPSSTPPPRPANLPPQSTEIYLPSTKRWMFLSHRYPYALFLWRNTST